MLTLPVEFTNLIVIFASLFSKADTHGSRRPLRPHHHVHRRRTRHRRGDRTHVDEFRIAKEGVLGTGRLFFASMS